MAEILVDSNVLVYAHDLSEPEKQLRALEVLDRLVEAALGVLSAQTLAEFSGEEPGGRVEHDHRDVIREQLAGLDKLAALPLQVGGVAGRCQID